VDIIFLGMGIRPADCFLRDVAVHLLYLLARRQERLQREIQCKRFTRKVATVEITFEEKAFFRSAIQSSFTPRLVESK
jgi:hypothetical protein